MSNGDSMGGRRNWRSSRRSSRGRWFFVRMRVAGTREDLTDPAGLRAVARPTLCQIPTRLRRACSPPSTCARDVQVPERHRHKDAHRLARCIGRWCAPAWWCSTSSSSRASICRSSRRIYTSCRRSAEPGVSRHLGRRLIVLGSIHAEMTALLEADAPLYHRATDHLDLRHLDLASSATARHARGRPHRLLFLWNLFEACEVLPRLLQQGVLRGTREELIGQCSSAARRPCAE